MREFTRRQRHDIKLPTCVWLPASVACINFSREGNLAYVIRAAACFGVKDIYLIGNCKLNYQEFNNMSGSTLSNVNLIQLSTPEDLIEISRNKNFKLISFELPQDVGLPGTSLEDYQFDFKQEQCLVVGHEQSGVPMPILKHSEIVYIPMGGPSYCLNTSQTANVALYELAKQYKRSLSAK